MRPRRRQEPSGRVACVTLPHVAAALEERDNPQLKGRPLAIEAPQPGPRVVFDLSYAAHRSGVRAGMTLTQARKVCPEITVLTPRIEDYELTFQAMVRTLTDFTSAVEPADLERSWLSTTGLVARHGLERSLAHELAAQVRREVELAVRVGLAHGKQTSTIVTRYGSEDDVMVLPPGREVPFLHGLSVGYLPMADASLSHLGQLGIRKIHQYASLPSRGILPRFGYEGLQAYYLSHGEDDPHVQAYRSEPFFDAEHVFLEPVADLEMLSRLLAQLAQQVAGPLSQSFQMAGVLRLSITPEDGAPITLDRTMDSPTVNARRLATQAEALVAAMELDRPVERVNLAIQGLCATRGRQLHLFHQDHVRREEIARTLRHIQRKFGDGIVQQGHRLEPESPLPERRAYLAPWGAAPATVGTV